MEDEKGFDIPSDPEDLEKDLEAEEIIESSKTLEEKEKELEDLGLEEDESGDEGNEI